MTIQEKAIEQLERISEHLSAIGEKEDYTDIAIQALESQQSRCDSCTHSEEQDGSNCYECVKGTADNFEAQPKTGYISIDLNKFAKKVAEKALDEITYEGKTIREWVEILVNQQPSEDCVSRTAEMNGCQYCKYKYRSDEDEPCIICSHNYTDKFKDDGTREANTDGYSD